MKKVDRVVHNGSVVFGFILAAVLLCLMLAILGSAVYWLFMTFSGLMLIEISMFACWLFIILAPIFIGISSLDSGWKKKGDDDEQ